MNDAMQCYVIIIQMIFCKSSPSRHPSRDRTSVPGSSFEMIGSSPSPSTIGTNHPATVLCTIINPSTTGRYHKLTQNNLFAAASVVCRQKTQADCTKTAFGAALVNANDQSTDPDSGARRAVKGTRRTACRSETSAFSRGERTESIGYPDKA